MPDFKMRVCQLRILDQLLRQGDWALNTLLCSVAGWDVLLGENIL